MYKYYSSNYTMHAQCINETTNVAIWNMNVDCVNKKNALFQFILCTNFVISFHFVSYIFEQILFGNFSYNQCSDILNDLMKKNSSWNAISENISLWTLNISLLTYRMEEDVSKLTLSTFFLRFFSFWNKYNRLEAV